MAETLARFTLESAERIGRVVRYIETKTEDGRSLSFRSPAESRSRSRPVFRIGTFSGGWPKGTSETVTFKYSSGTVNATNLFAEIATSSSSTRDCAIAREGTAWFLIAAEC